MTPGGVPTDPDPRGVHGDEFIRRLLASTPDCIKVLALDGRLLSMNATGVRLFEIDDLAPYLNARWPDLLPAEARGAAEQALDTARAGGSGRFETFAPTAKGSPRWWEMTVTPIARAGGQAEALLAISRDITDRRLAEQASRTSEERYRALFEAIDEGFCVIEVIFNAAGRPADYRFVEVNPQFERQTGLANATGKRVRELAPAHEEHWFETYGRVALTGEPLRFVNQAKALDGRWFDAFAFRVGGPESRTVGVLFRDITDRRRADEALRASERRHRELAEELEAERAKLEAAFESMAIGVGLVDSRTGATLYQNAAGLRLHGFGSAADMVAGLDDYRRDWELRHPDGRAMPFEQWPIGKALRGEFVRDYPVRMLHRPSGHERHVSYTAAPVRDRAGSPVLIVFTMLDVTEARQAEESLRASRAQLARHRDDLEEAVRRTTEELDRSHLSLAHAERMAALGTFAAGLGHDMANALFPLRATLADLTGRPDLPADARTDLLAADRAMSYLSSLTRGLRLFTRDANAAEREEDAAGASLVAVWTDLEPFLRTSLPKAGITLQASLAPDLPAVAVAPHRLAQVLMNLVHNARDAILEARGPAADGRIEVRAAPEHDPPRVRLEVGDNGCGMSVEVRRRCLEPFFTTKARQRGTGLGLAMVHGIVRSAGERDGPDGRLGEARGWIEIESQPGRGTTVAVVFPSVAMPGTAHTPRSPPDDPRAGADRPTAALVPPPAAVTVRDTRLAALARSLLSGAAGTDSGPAAHRVLGRAPEPDEPVSIWVTDATPERLPRATAFLRHSPGRRVVAVHPPARDEAAWEAAGTTVLRGDDPPARLRDLLAPQPPASAR